MFYDRNMSHEELDDFLSRFRLSIRLEATQRVLRAKWRRQLGVGVIAFWEISATAVVPGIHLVTSRYITMAVLLLLLLMSCWRARSVFDPFLHPAHVLRPKYYSRFGLGRNQKACSAFASASILVRLACAVTFAVIFLHYLVATTAGHILCTERSLGAANWAHYTQSEISSDLEICGQNLSQNGKMCHVLPDFNRRCNDPARWSQRLLEHAHQFGHTCAMNQTHEVAFSDLSQFDNEFCETPGGMELDYCTEDDFTETDLVIWTSGEIALNQACESWPQKQFTFYCYLVFKDTNHCSNSKDSSIWNSILARSCEIHRCTAGLPGWLRSTLLKSELLNLCDCRTCKPCFTSNVCLLEELDHAHRRRAGLQHFDVYGLNSLFQDPTYSVQIFAILLMLCSPVILLLALAVFYCRAGNPFALPCDVELQQRICKEEETLREELRSGGCISTSPCFNRCMMLFQLGYYVGDIILDFEMLVLYQSKKHYWFAAMQGCILLWSFIGLTRQCLCGPKLLCEILDSFRANLRTDVVHAILQKERTGEAVLSFVLQVYAIAYMSTEITSFWTALLSVIMSGAGIAYGFYIYFDLAVVFGEMDSGIVPSKEDGNEMEPTSVQVSPAPAEKYLTGYIGENLQREAAETNNSKAPAAPTQIGASSSFNVIVPNSNSTHSIAVHRQTS